MTKKKYSELFAVITELCYCLDECFKIETGFAEVRKRLFDYLVMQESPVPLEQLEEKIIPGVQSIYIKAIGKKADNKYDKATLYIHLKGDDAGCATLIAPGYLPFGTSFRKYRVKKETAFGQACPDSEKFEHSLDQIMDVIMPAHRDNKRKIKAARSNYRPFSIT